MPRVFVIGNVNVDLILGPHQEWPRLGTEVLVDRTELRVGGSAGNSLLALHALGANAVGVVSAGTDPFGNWLRDEMRHIPGRWVTSQAPTSVTVALSHVSGERTFFTHLGHLAELAWSDIEPSIDDMQRGDLVLLTGAFLTPRLRRQYPAMLAAFKDRQLRVAIDPGWPPEGWTAEVRDEVRRWFALCDDILLNQQELCAFVGLTELQAAAAQVRQMLPAPGILVVKCGAQGAHAWSGGQAVQVSAPRVTVMDTVGAGDTFNAAFLWSSLRGYPTADALHQGVIVASQAISTSPRNYHPSHLDSAQRNDSGVAR